MPCKFDQLRDWEKALILRCHIAGKIKGDADDNNEDCERDDGSIDAAVFINGEGDFPATAGFPEDWFKLFKGRSGSPWRELTAHAKRELEEQQERIEEYTKRNEKLAKEVEIGRDRIKDTLRELNEILEQTKRSIQTARHIISRL